MISTAVVSLISHFEGCKLTAYLCPAGVWTIGYGHTHGVKEGDTCTVAQANAWLAEDIGPIDGLISRLVTVPLKQHQRDALACLIFNIGSGNFENSTLLRKLNAGDYAGAAEQFGRWNRAGEHVLPGLISRRAAERSLFEGATNELHHRPTARAVNP